MQSEKTILVVGGDLRYAYTARALADKCSVHALGLMRQLPGVHCADTPGELPGCDILVLPMPVSEDGVTVHAPYAASPVLLRDLLPLLHPGALVLGGRFGKAEDFFRMAGYETDDYSRREEFALFNAIPTAEGAVGILLDELPRTLYGASVLVTGYGRIGRFLAMLLCSFGAEVTVAARRSADRARAEMNGCHAIPVSALAEEIGRFDAVCNTVPVCILTADVLAAMREDALILDLASKPGGTDREAAQKLGRRFVWALSLPGRTAPVTAGQTIARTVMQMLAERGLAP
ncbi:MAG: dipicolinic acid synthetase [Oscillospiraceae bacterium]|nr:dipicolinic acid synthetase [Oscillospiraceae bacterium]MBR1897459.1 dipicolinic acid synthetase [Oscillospiraceae bacterium]